MKNFDQIISNNILVKLAETEEEYSQVYKLRYQELLLEYNQNINLTSNIDKDIYDEFCDHLIAIDINTNKVIGSYRLIKKSHLKVLNTFLTETEFNIDKLKKYEILELGRAVVQSDYRDGVTIGMLWKGVIKYALSQGVEVMIGTASFHGINPNEYKETFSYLYDNHLSNEELRCYANKDSYSPLKLVEEYDMQIAKKQMPPLIKGYINLGATIGDGIYIDKEFNSCDVLIVLMIKEINPRYLKKYL